MRRPARKGSKNHAISPTRGEGRRGESRKGANLSRLPPPPARFRDGGNARPIIGHKVGGWDAQPGILRLRGVQYAFEDSMTRGILRFVSSIAIRCVFHRCESQDIHRCELFFMFFGGYKSAFLFMLPGCFQLRGRGGPPERRVHCQ